MRRDVTEVWLAGSEAAAAAGRVEAEGGGHQELASSECSVFSLSCNNL